MLRKIILPALLLIFAFLFPSPSPAAQYLVKRVIDEDLLVVFHDGTKITIRLVGIDALELSNKKRKDGAT